MKLTYSESLCADDGLCLPIVCLHAFPIHRQMWRHQLDALSERHRVLSLDFRGYGDTPAAPDSDGFTVQQFAQDVLDTLDDIGITRAVFAGCSMGGYVLFELWRQAPDLIAGLVLADTKAEADNEQQRAGRFQRIDAIRAEGTAGLPDSTADMLSPKTRSERPQVEVQVRDWSAQPTAETVIATLQMLANRPDSLGTLPTINVPALILVGENDKVTPLENAQTLHREIPASTLQIIPAAGHLSPLEQPDETNDAIRNFLLQHDEL